MPLLTENFQSNNDEIILDIFNRLNQGEDYNVLFSEVISKFTIDNIVDLKKLTKRYFHISYEQVIDVKSDGWILDISDVQFIQLNNFFIGLNIHCASIVEQSLKEGTLTSQSNTYNSSVRIACHSYFHAATLVRGTNERVPKTFTIDKEIELQQKGIQIAQQNVDLSDASLGIKLIFDEVVTEIDLLLKDSESNMSLSPLIQASNLYLWLADSLSAFYDTLATKALTIDDMPGRVSAKEQQELLSFHENFFSTLNLGFTFVFQTIGNIEEEIESTDIDEAFVTQLFKIKSTVLDSFVLLGARGQLLFSDKFNESKSYQKLMYTRLIQILFSRFDPRNFTFLNYKISPNITLNSGDHLIQSLEKQKSSLLIIANQIINDVNPLLDLSERKKKFALRRRQSNIEKGIESLLVERQLACVKFMQGIKGSKTTMKKTIIELNKMLDELDEA